MAPKLYVLPQSAPTRAVLMTAKALNLELELIYATPEIKEELRKINPQHSAPTLVDEDGFVIWDSHAIITYLVAKYGKDDSLYPKDLKQRTVIDQRLHFEGAVSFACVGKIYPALMHTSKTDLEQSEIENILEVYGLIEAFLEGKQWITGDSLTVADFSLISSITSLALLLDVDPQKFPQTFDWIERAKQLSVYNVNQEGLDKLKSIIGK